MKKKINVDKIVNKIFNHYNNLNKLEDLKIVLKKYKNIEKQNVNNVKEQKVNNVKEQKIKIETKKIEDVLPILNCGNNNGNNNDDNNDDNIGNNNDDNSGDNSGNNSGDNSGDNNDNNDNNTRPQLTNLIEKYFNNSELNSEQEALKNFIDDYKKNPNTSLILIGDSDKKEFNLYYHYQFTGIVLSVDNKSTFLNKNIYKLRLLYFFSGHINFLTDKNYLLLDSFTITNEINLDDFSLTNSGVSSPFYKLNLNLKTIEPFNNI